MRGDGTVIDDASAARLLRLHDLDGFLRAQETAREVDGHHAVPLLIGQVFHRDGGRSGAGVVEQQVETAERRLDASE